MRSLASVVVENGKLYGLLFSDNLEQEPDEWVPLGDDTPGNRRKYGGMIVDKGDRPIVVVADNGNLYGFFLADCLYDSWLFLGKDTQELRRELAGIPIM